MLSAIFVDRPRLAIVIAVVTTIAGALALLAMPVAQYPDIVPPQVSVTTMYPGANSAVVDATVAQPIEAQVVGVDKMMYMKSTSGDDGSYTLTASFELGTDPDINTVNVNNRVQTALSSLPPEVQRQGITVKKKSTAILACVIASTRRSKRTIRCSCRTMSPSICSIQSRAPQASATRTCSPPRTMRCARGFGPTG